MLVLLPLLLLAQEPEEVPVLSVGETLEGEVSEEASEVHSPTLDASDTQAPTVGVTYRIVVEESGPYYIDLKSYDFDAYLVLEDSSETILQRADGGSIGSHARLDLTLDALEEYLVYASASDGAAGSFSIALMAGQPPEVTGEAQVSLEINNSREAVRHAEANFGAESVEVAGQLESLGNLLFGAGEREEAIQVYERLVSLRESLLGPEHLETGIALANLGVALNSRGRGQEGLPLLLRALKIHESELGSLHSDVAITLDSIGQVQYALGDLLAARDSYERALSIRTELFGDSHTSVALVLGSLALVLEDEGDLEGARVLLEKSLSIWESIKGASSREMSSTLNNLAALLHRVGDTVAAKAMYERALEIREREYGTRHPRTATSLNNLAGLLADLGEQGRAADMYRRALAIREASLGANHPMTAGTRLNLAHIFREEWDLVSALPLFEADLEYCELVSGRASEETARCMMTLADVLLRLGFYSRAQGYAEQSLEIREGLLGIDHPRTAYCLGFLGEVFRRSGEYETALAMSQAALETTEAARGPYHAETISCRSNLALALFSVGEYDRARRLYEEVLLAEQSTPDVQPSSLATTLHNLGLVLDKQGELVRAQEFFARALSIRTASLGEGHPSVLSEMASLAGSMIDTGDTGKALRLLLEREESVRQQLQSLLASRTPREGFEYVSRLRVDQELLFSMSSLLPSPETNRVVLERVLAWKGQVGRAARIAREARAGSTASEEVALAIRHHQVELSRIAYDKALDPLQREKRVTLLQDRISQLTLEFRGLVVQPTSPHVALEALLGTLPERGALVCFLVYSAYQPALRSGGELTKQWAWGAPHLAAWVARPSGEVAYVDLGDAKEIARFAAEFGASVSGEARGEPLGRRTDGEALRRRLWDPLISALGDSSLIVLSPDSFVAAIPFGALPSPGGKYLVEDYEFVRVHDLLSDSTTEERGARSRSLLTVGGVDFGLATPQEKTIAATPDGPGLKSPVGQWRQLPGSRSEAEAVESLFKSTFQSDFIVSLTGAEATESEVMSRLPSASVVHLATHGFFVDLRSGAVNSKGEELTSRGGSLPSRSAKLIDGLEPDLGILDPSLRSGVVLAGANVGIREDGQDGILTAVEFEWLDLSGVDLVTLSTCESGLGVPRSGEAMSGFQATLSIAGVKSIITSLWSVPDEETRHLMERLYSNLWAKGMGKLEALREAQLWMLRENRRKYDGDGRPHTWGAFVLSGDWR